MLSQNVTFSADVCIGIYVLAYTVDRLFVYKKRKKDTIQQVQSGSNTLLGNGIVQTLFFLLAISIGIVGCIEYKQTVLTIEDAENNALYDRLKNNLTTE